MTKRNIWATAAVAVMTATGFISVSALNDWVGDWGAVLWIACSYGIPFVSGAAWGARANSRMGAIAGAALGVVLVMAPTLGYVIVSEPDIMEAGLPMVWGVFTPLAAVHGLIAMRVGGTARRRRTA